MMSLGKTKADRKWVGRKQRQGELNQSVRGREWTQLPFEVASSSSVENHPEAFLPQTGRRIAWLAVLWPSAPGARRAPPGPGRWTLPTWEEYTHWSSALTQHNISSIESYLMQVISSVRYNTTSIEKMAPRDILSSGRPSILLHQDWRLPMRVFSILRCLKRLITSIEPEFPKGFHIWPLKSENSDNYFI